MKIFRFVFFIGIFFFFPVSILHSFIIDKGNISSMDTLNYNNHSSSTKDAKQKKKLIKETNPASGSSATKRDNSFQDAIYKLQRDAMLKEKKRLLRQSADRRNKLHSYIKTNKHPDLKYSYFNTSQNINKSVRSYKIVSHKKEKDTSKELSTVDRIANFLGFIVYITFIGAIIMFFVKGGKTAK